MSVYVVKKKHLCAHNMQTVEAVAEQVGQAAKETTRSALRNALRSGARINSSGAQTRFQSQFTLPAQRQADDDASRRNTRSNGARPGLPALTRRVERMPRLSDTFVRSSSDNDFENFAPEGPTQTAEQVQRQLDAQESAERQLRSDFERALYDGPEALRHRQVAAVNITIPIPAGIQTESDGIVPESTDNDGPTYIPRFYVTESGIAWPRGERIVPRSQFAFVGPDAVDVIDPSVVTVVGDDQTGRNGAAAGAAGNDSFGWLAAATIFIVALVLVILYAVNQALQKRVDTVVIEADTVDLEVRDDLRSEADE